MQWAHPWTEAFDYENLGEVIAAMQVCDALEKSRIQHKLPFHRKT